MARRGLQLAKSLVSATRCLHHATICRGNSVSTPFAKAAVAGARPSQWASGRRALYSHVDSGMEEDRRLHEYAVARQYEAEHKREFYREVMGDGTDNIHFGKWDGIDALADGAYGQAALATTQWMWSKAMDRFDGPDVKNIHYLDLGAGTGSAARKICRADARVHATCINLTPSQNLENLACADHEGLANRVTVQEGTYMDMPAEWSGKFSGCFSQDALLHAFSKEAALREALRVTRPGGFLVLCDLNDGPGPKQAPVPPPTQEISMPLPELEKDMLMFDTAIMQDNLSWTQLVSAAYDAGWCDVEYEDMSQDLRKSFLVMGRKVTEMLESGKYDEHRMLPVLRKFEESLFARVEQVECGVFSWGALIARKPNP